MNTYSKPVMITVTDPAEIFSIKQDGFADIIGSKATDGNYRAYKKSVEAWRERQKAQGSSNTDPGGVTK